MVIEDGFMASPTPSDLLWVTGFPIQGRWLMPLLREAVRSEWSRAVDIATSQLGDDADARELMETAIAQTQEILVDEGEAPLDDVRRILMRCYQNAVRRAYRQQTKLSLWGSTMNLDQISSPISGHTRQVEARLDLDLMLRDTPEDIKHALLLRYGARSSWAEIAKQTANTKDGIRMRCKRELNRIARHFGISRKTGGPAPDSEDRR